MRELGLKCVKFMRKSRKYNSYKGLKNTSTGITTYDQK